MGPGDLSPGPYPEKEGEVEDGSGILRKLRMTKRMASLAERPMKDWPFGDLSLDKERSLRSQRRARRRSLRTAERCVMKRAAIAPSITR